MTFCVRILSIEEAVEAGKMVLRSKIYNNMETVKFIYAEL